MEMPEIPTTPSENDDDDDVTTALDEDSKLSLLEAKDDSRPNTPRYGTMPAERTTESNASGKSRSSGKTPAGIFSRYSHEICVASAMILAGMTFGFPFAFTSSVVPVLKADGVFDGKEASLFESLLLLGGLTGSLMSAVLVGVTGRKGPMLLCGLPYLVGWTCLIVGHGKPVLFIGRFLTGVGNGLNTVSFGLYAAEVICLEIRGAVLVSAHLGTTLGVVTGYLLGLFLERRWLALCSLLPAVITLVEAAFLPESPRWLVINGRIPQAKKALMWLRNGNSADVREELDAMQENTRLQSDNGSSGFLQIVGDFRRTLRPFGIALSIIVLNQLSGISLVLFNLQEIFDSAGYPTGSQVSKNAVIIVSVVKLAVTLLSATIVDKLGRRPLFIFGGVTMGVGGLTFGFFFHFPATFHESSRWVPVLCLVLYTVGYGLGWGGIVWLVIPELLPIRIRGYGSGIASALAWMMGFAFVSEYQALVDAVTMAGLFWIFGSVCLLGALYAYIVLPETKQRSLEQIELSVSGSNR